MGNQPYIIVAVASPICVGISHYLLKGFCFCSSAVHASAANCSSLDFAS